MRKQKVLRYRDADLTQEEYEKQSLELAEHFGITVEELREAQKNWDMANESFESAVNRIKSQQK